MGELIVQLPVAEPIGRDRSYRQRRRNSPGDVAPEGQLRVVWLLQPPAPEMRTLLPRTRPRPWETTGVCIGDPPPWSLGLSLLLSDSPVAGEEKAFFKK